MTRRNIHPIYFQSMLGKWKTIDSSDQPGMPSKYLSFFENTKYEESYDTRGTVNGDVDEVSIDGETGSILAINGTLKLSSEGTRQNWRFTLDRAVGIQPGARPQISDSTSDQKYNLLTLTGRTGTVNYAFFAVVNELESNRRGKAQLIP